MAATPETPSFPPPSPSLPRHVATPHSCRPRTPSRLSLSPIKCHVSPSKSRNTPLRSPARSPRKSPSKNLQSVKSVSFTPQRNKQPPRAWERRPATPFVPRDEKQKIWKRMPLGEIGLDPNRPVGSSRRQQESTKDYARVVKKLKVAHNAGQGEWDEDKENVNNAFTADMKVVTEDGDSKRGAVGSGGTRGFVSMRMEDNEIEGSPKKKLRQPTMEQDPEIGGHKEAKEEDNNEDVHKEAGVKQESVSAEEGMESTLEEVSPMTEHTGQPSDDLRDHTEGDAEVEAALEEAQESQEEAVNSDPVEPVEDQWQRAMIPAEVHITAQDPDVNEAQVSGATSSPERMPANEEVFPGHEPRSSSPPTILAENVTVDELEARESPTPAKTKTIAEAQYHESSKEQLMVEGSATQDALHRRVSDDDTAFLRAFMSRTKATKAERAAQDQTLHNITQNGITNLVDEQEPAMTKTSDRLAPAVKLQPVEQETQEDAAPTSPLRRSKRAVVTSIPRPQALTNSIQLKRANGNEFIFKANQASSTATAAIATRSNTKKNKGTALNVPARLEQILAEKTKEQSAEIEPSTKNSSASKKRKRDKNDTGSKVRKVLRWNDENLVSYQEAEQNLTDDIEDSSQERAGEESKENHEPIKHVKSALTLSSGEDVSTEAGKTEEQAKSTVQAKEDSEKVRRVRRGIAGSINGTPAPKTRSQSILESDGVDVPAEEGPPAMVSEAATVAVGALKAEESSQSTSTSAREKTTAAAAAMTRKSRMPVPSAVSRRAIASASGKTGESSFPARVTAASLGGREKSKAGSKTVASGDNEKEREKGDLLGKRRLRVRS